MFLLAPGMQLHQHARRAILSDTELRSTLPAMQNLQECGGLRMSFVDLFSRHGCHYVRLHFLVVRLPHHDDLARGSGR